MHGRKKKISKDSLKACFENVNIPLYSTLHNDCSHIEDVYLLFCAHLINIFSFFEGFDL